MDQVIADFRLAKKRLGKLVKQLREIQTLGADELEFSEVLLVNASKVAQKFLDIHCRYNRIQSSGTPEWIMVDSRTTIRIYNITRDLRHLAWKMQELAAFALEFVVACSGMYDWRRLRLELLCRAEDILQQVKHELMKD